MMKCTLSRRLIIQNTTKRLQVWYANRETALMLEALMLRGASRTGIKSFANIVRKECRRGSGVIDLYASCTHSQESDALGLSRR
jgi:hypothetical protein